MTKHDYLSIIDDMFSEDGAIVRAGGRYNPQQREYAAVIAQGLFKPESVVAAEATTGIGKSIGYLVPSLVLLALGKGDKQILVSTHTRALQRQLMSKDMTLALQAVEEQGLKLPKVAFRMGRPAFFSPTRVNDLIESLDESKITAQHKELSRFANACSVSGSGLWIDYIDNFGGFPDGIVAEDICLLDLMVSDNPAYDKHIADARDAELIITNHATILSRYVFKDQKFHAVICDEAHEIEDVCVGLATHKSQLKRIISALIETNLSAKSLKKAVDLSTSIDARLREFDTTNNSSKNLISDIEDSHLIDSIQEDVIALQKQLNNSKTQFVKTISGSMTHKQAKVIDRIDKHIQTLSAFERGTYKNKRRAVGFSPKYRDASLASVSLNAGLLFNYRMSQLTDRVILVSATMSNAAAKKLSFGHLLYALGIKEDRVTAQCSIEPAEFGKMSFIVVPKGKSPLIKAADIEDEFVFDETWLKNTAGLIDAAAAKGKTLVLSPSIKESKRLAKMIDSTHLVQDENAPLIQLVENFIHGDANVLLSAGAWAGVSLRDTNDNQLIKSLVITRIPFIPIDAEQQFLQREYLLGKGLSEAQIKGVEWTKLQYKTMIKLKQGIGRGLRSPSDDITVWFADPRMPTSFRPTGLLAAIPRRFLSDYYQAAVYQSQEEDVAEKEVFYI